MASVKEKKTRVPNIEKKAEIIEKLRKGSSVTHLAKEYGVAKSTICNFKLKAGAILGAVASTFNGPGKRKTLKGSVLPNMEKHLYKWFLEQRHRNSPINGTILKEKAKHLFGKYEGASARSFNASDGWLQRFRKRFGIRLLKITGEKLSSQPTLVDPFKKKLQEIIKDLNLHKIQLYNADETDLYWKMLPANTYVLSTEKSAPGRKTEKQKITVLFCTNAEGDHKLKPLIIGKSKKV